MERIGIEDSTLVVDTAIVARGFALEPGSVRDLLRAGAITSVAERGVGRDAGRWRLSFFHAGRRLQLIVGADGGVVRETLIDLGKRPPP
jgi:hypothetical protein